MNPEQYYAVPINFSALSKKKEVKVCNFYTSIAQNIFIVLTTKYDECRYDPEFGSEIWEWDFRHIPNENTWIDQMSKALSFTIKKYETRLYDIMVDIRIQQEEVLDPKKSLYRIKKRLEVLVKGTVKETREPFHFQQTLYLSPISFD